MGKRKIEEFENEVKVESDSSLDEHTEDSSPVLKKVKSEHEEEDPLHDSSDEEVPASPSPAGRKPFSELYQQALDIVPHDDPEFSRVPVRMLIALPPCYTNDPMQGVYGYFNCFLMQHLPFVSGVVLAYSDVKVESSLGLVANEHPFPQFWVQAELLVWKPSPGSRLKGRINVQSNDHIGLLLYKNFNASIPAELIPEDIYEWRESKEFAPATKKRGKGKKSQKDENGEPPAMLGEWVHKETGESIGDNGWLQFTTVE
ncbi:hypothetical protein IWQ62_005188 [Dispira parvispora]|uniref:RPA43 OB domain-containing protein n=1 Tax=Dispira parvispora TaxID=1520584 RepID=A0A9W8AKX8_9FUNG|nr:hypothetical protein IWQ62_005188 [Dispira parvispora]